MSLSRAGGMEMEMKYISYPPGFRGKPFFRDCDVYH